MVEDTPRQENVIITVKELGKQKEQTMYNDFGLRKPPVYECVNAGQVPTWMTEGCNSTHHERQEQRDICRKLQTNCLPPLIWKLLTSIFSEAMYGHLSSHELLKNEQK